MYLTKKFPFPVAGRCSPHPDDGDHGRVPEVLATQLSTKAGAAGENCRQGTSMASRTAGENCRQGTSMAAGAAGVNCRQGTSMAAGAA